MIRRFFSGARCHSLTSLAVAIPVGIAAAVSSLAQGASEPPPPPHASPLPAEIQQSTFGLPPGFVAELVAAEPDGGKFVALQFDHAGRLWAMTALEYPLDANEAGEEARALFARGGRDRVVVFDTPTRPGRQQARTFADGLVMPLGLLPYRGGAFVQYGPEIRYYVDANRDGRAEGYSTILGGFGIEDSHLFPHQFTRAPGGWLWLAQGAFNYSEVRTSDGKVTPFNKTKLARWRPDGSRFEIIGWGPCNIWGLVLDRHGEAFIQEANDQGWPMMPFLEGASYPLCGDDVPRPYAPPFPKTGGREMGGTGLSGLALSEGADSFPGDWRDVFFVNNPITRKIQAIRLHRSADPGDSAAGPRAYGNGWQLEHLPDFALSSDPWFRPVAMTFGPDGCLYVVDWYNQIISHNEVPRKHPERDKARGRIWRFRHQSQPHRIEVPNLYEVPEMDLLHHLAAVNTWEATAAWHEIVDRNAEGLAPGLAAILDDASRPADLRIRALWCLEELGRLERPHILTSLAAPERSLRREALRAAATLPATRLPADEAVALARQSLDDSDRLVRQEAIRWQVRLLNEPAAAGPVASAAAGALIQAAASPPPASDARYSAFFDAFEAYLIRGGLEQAPEALDAWLASQGAIKGEATAFAALARGGASGARRLAAQWPGLERAPSGDELMLLAGNAGDPVVRSVLESALANPSALRQIHARRAALGSGDALARILEPALKALVVQRSDPESEELMIQLAEGFRLPGLENELIAAATRTNAGPAIQASALRALRASGSTRLDVFRQLALSAHEPVRREAVAALSSSRSDEAVASLLELWATLSPPLRRQAVDRLTQSPGSARQLLAAVGEGAIAQGELNGYALERLSVVLPDHPRIRELEAALGSSRRPVLRLDGTDEAYIATNLSLEGPFTVETWVRLDPPIGNQDSILGGADQLDANFYDGRFRIWIGGGVHDIAVARRPVTAGHWTHVAFTRDAEGYFRIYLDGALEATSAGRDNRQFTGLDVGRSNVPGGTAGQFAYYRIWSRCRDEAEVQTMAGSDIPGTIGDLLYRSSGESWGSTAAGARVELTGDVPPVLDAAEAAALESRFARYRVLPVSEGDRESGRQQFIALCAPCHAIGGDGGRIGPALDGAGAHGLEALLRNLLTPNAAIEAGYRRFRVETVEGDVIEGLLVSQDADSVTVRVPGAEDQRHRRSDLRRASFLRDSLMPEGLLEGIEDSQARDLLAYLLDRQ